MNLELSMWVCLEDIYVHTAPLSGPPRVFFLFTKLQHFMSFLSLSSSTKGTFEIVIPVG